MKGIVFDEGGLSVVTDLTVRDVRDDEVRVDIQAAGVCHSDVSVIDGMTSVAAGDSIIMDKADVKGGVYVIDPDGKLLAFGVSGAVADPVQEFGVQIKDVKAEKEKAERH